MIPPRKILLLFVQLFFVASSLIAQEKYWAVHWGMNEGLSLDLNNVMLKDLNGFLWIGSPQALNRFDGSNFKQYFPDKNKPGTIIGSSIHNLIEDSLHNIWIGTEKGLSRYDIKADTFRNFLPDTHAVNGDIDPFWATRDEVYCVETGSSITAYNIHSFAKKILANLSPEYAGGGIRRTPPVFDAKSNSIWMVEGGFTQPGGGLFQVSLNNGKKNHYTWQCYKNISNHSHLSNDMCYDSKRNAIWISSPDGLIEFTLDDKQFHPADGLNEIVNQKDFSNPGGVNLDQQGLVWWDSSPKGIIIYDPSTRSFTPLFSNPSRQQAYAFPCYHIYCDRDGIVWASGWYAPVGIYQIIPASIPVFRYSGDTSQAHLLSGDNITNIIKADHGKLWIGQGDKLTVFDPQTGFFQLLFSGENLPTFKEMVIAPVQIDTIHQKALFDIDNGQPGNGLIQMDISTKQCRPLIFEDSAGQIMPAPPKENESFPYKNGAILFCDDGMYTVNIDSAIARWVAPPGINDISGFSTNNDHLIFMTHPVTNLTYSLLNGKWTKISSPLDSISWIGRAIYYNEKDKTYWVGDWGQLIHYDKDFRLIRRYTQKDGLITEDISNILADNRGNIWIQTVKSILELNIKTEKITLLSVKDGLKKQSYGANAPVESGGNLFFWGDDGIDRVSPDKLTENYPPSLVYLKSLEINQKPFSLPTGINNLQELSVRYNQNKISIETGIIDYYTKGGSRIRYKLEEVNENWQVSPGNYTIRYDGLSPGKYTLVLQASNAAGDFNGPEKLLVINIRPPFWQTWWFKTLMSIVLILILYGIYRWRTASLRKQKRVLEQTVKERTAEVVEEKAQIEKQKDVIQKEKERSDELLLNILPSEVAEELKEKGYTTAKSFDEVTILFSDIKGFTHVAERMTAQELVKEIDTYFSAFDHIMQQYGLEKIKTIGDAYIAAGGLPEGNSANASKVVDAAIAMQNAVESFKKERIEKDLPHFELRIGIHTGPVVAGVVGIKKFQYDIWGDTVNMAARMEQSGVPGKINISQYTYEKVMDQFTCTHRGKIEAKNKGDVDMYFVEMKISKEK